MTERWRKPAGVIEIGEATDLVWESPDGRKFSVPEIVVDNETKERIRLGYMCMLCFQPFEQAWPEVCDFCGARVRDGQGDYFSKMAREQALAVETDWDAEIAEMVERHARLRREGKLL